VLVSVYIFEQRGVVSGVYNILPKTNIKNHKHSKINRQAIIDVFRQDCESANYGMEHIGENPSRDVSSLKSIHKCAYFPVPTSTRLKLYEKLPIMLPDRKIIDVFTCFGSRFGLEPKTVFVEICCTLSGEYYANLMYTENPDHVLSIISVVEHTFFCDEQHIDSLHM